MHDIDVERLGAITLPDNDGDEVHLADLWEAHPAVLLVLRHFG